MQNPPGPPSGPPPGGQQSYGPSGPPGQQPYGGPPGQPYGQPPQRSSSGMDSKTGSLVAYILQWLTGIIMLFVGKDDPNIKYHAAQSVVFFGGLTVLNILVRIVDAFLPSGIGFILGLVLFVFGIYQFIVWILCMVWAWTRNGERFQIPLLGGIVTPYAERLAGSV